MAQVHTKMGLGNNKALALQQVIKQLFGVPIEAFPRKLIPDNVEILLGRSSLVIDCTDNIEARKLIQKFTQAHNIPCLHSALSASGDFARIVWTEHFVPDPEGTPGQATCEDGEMLPFFAAVAAQTTIVAQEFLSTSRRTSYQMTPQFLLRVV